MLTDGFGYGCRRSYMYWWVVIHMSIWDIRRWTGITFVVVSQWMSTFYFGVRVGDKVTITAFWCKYSCDSRVRVFSAGTCARLRNTRVCRCTSEKKTALNNSMSSGCSVVSIIKRLGEYMLCVRPVSASTQCVVCSEHSWVYEIIINLNRASALSLVHRFDIILFELKSNKLDSKCSSTYRWVVIISVWFLALLCLLRAFPAPAAFRCFVRPMMENHSKSDCSKVARHVYVK